MRNLKKYNKAQIVSVELNDLKPIAQLEFVPAKPGSFWKKAQPEGWRWKNDFLSAVYSRGFLEKEDKVIFVNNTPHYGINTIVKYSDGSQQVREFRDDYEKAKEYYDSLLQSNHN